MAWWAIGQSTQLVSFVNILFVSNRYTSHALLDELSPQNLTIFHHPRILLVWQLLFESCLEILSFFVSRLPRFCSGSPKQSMFPVLWMAMAIVGWLAGMLAAVTSWREKMRLKHFKVCHCVRNQCSFLSFLRSLCLCATTLELGNPMRGP